MEKIVIRLSEYNKMLKMLSNISEVSNRTTGNVKRKFVFSQNPPSIEDLQANGVTEEEFAGSYTEDLMYYLLYYSEMDVEGEEYLFIPDPKKVNVEKFEETRKYISRVLNHCVEIK